MIVGLLGLEYSGKKSLFSLLTGIKGDAYPSSREKVGMVDVPDERIDFLADYYHTGKKVYSKIEFRLMPPIKKDAREENTALVEAKDVDMFALVVRQFRDENVFHPLGSVDVMRDYPALKEELVFADLFLVETRLERIEKQMKSKPADQLDKERELLVQLRQQLEQGKYLQQLALDQESLKRVRSFCFLTLKPIFVIVNCDEDALNASFPFSDGVQNINISVKIENEIQQLDESSKKEFLGTLGLTEPSLDRLIKFAYAYGNLISFITAGEQESHSWTIKSGTPALKAAGAIHSDIEKGFIRAEVINFEDFKKAGSEAEARKRGLYRLEGKEYIVKDGDMIEFRFNV